MREQEPIALSQRPVLRPHTLYERNEGRRATIRAQNRLAVLAAQRVFRMIVQRFGEKSPMHV